MNSNDPLLGALKFRSRMHAAMEKAVNKTANAVLRDAQRMAPVRKIFKERGSARIEQRSFRVKARNGRWVTKTADVRSHRANRYSTSKLLRQAFHEVHPDRSGILPREAIAVGTSYGGEGKETYVAFSATRQLNSRGRYEVARMAKGYGASVGEGANINPIRKKLPSVLPGPYTSAAASTYSSSRQTMIRVKDTLSIKEIVNQGVAFHKERKRIADEARAEIKKVTKAGEKLAARTPRRRTKKNAALLNREQVMANTLHERERIFVKAKKKIAAVPKPAGGDIQRAEGRSMTAYERPIGTFRGAQLSQYAVHPAEGQKLGHFHLQAGGHLRNSIEIDFSDDAGTLSATIGTDVPYAKPMEFGTIHNKPFTFLRPALHNHQDEFLAAAKEGARGALKG